jgi:hypothetical protein
MEKKRITELRISIIGFIVMGIGFIYIFWREYYEDKLLLKTKIGFIERIYNGAVRSPKNVDFIYYVNGKKYGSNESGDYTFMKIGDTILIEYAVKDNSVARVVDKFYMKKYRRLKPDWY